jgi:ornithine carbamoyltransferase
LTLAFVGDGNNVARSLMLAASLTGMNFRIATPSGYAIEDNVFNLAQSNAISSGGEILRTGEPRLAVDGADVVYTDVWTSMGQETEAEARRRVFTGYQVNSELLSLAKEDAILMHPLPAHHGEEVAEGILDTPRSVVFDQAENRLHMQKALLAGILGGLEIPLAGYG